VMLWLFSVLLSLFDRKHSAPDDETGPSVADHVNVDAHRASKKSSCMGMLSRWIARVLSRGVVPRHIAFILDGNRRFAVKNQLEKHHGHTWGFDKLHETLEWCFDAGVRAVSVYAFSIENFKRPQKEVDTLMALATEKFHYLLEQSQLMRDKNVVIRIWGELSLLPAELRALMERVMRETGENVGPTLNVYFPYTSSHELVGVARGVAQDCVDERLDAQHVTQCVVEDRLQCSGPFPELLIRTSGETRLSDFLCWQTSRSLFLVFKCYWPEFSIFHFAMAVLSYRFHIKH